MSRVVKRTPDLGLKIRLQRVGDYGGAVSAPVGSGGGSGPVPCSVSGVSWALGLPYDSHFMDRIGAVDPPEFWVVSSALRTRRVFGVPFGDAPDDVDWTWSWSAAPERGETVEQVGSLLLVTLPNTHDQGVAYDRWLSASAYCGGAQVGTLSLRYRYDEF